MILEVMVWEGGLIDLPPGYGNMVGFCECCNELRIPYSQGNFLTENI